MLIFFFLPPLYRTMTFSPKVRAANVNQDDKTRATPRKSRPLRRKTSHSVIERRRREKINEGLIHLQDIVPACRQELKELLDCKVKMNKKNAKRSLIELQTEVENLSKEKSNSEMVLEKLVSLPCRTLVRRSDLTWRDIYSASLVTRLIMYKNFKRSWSHIESGVEVVPLENHLSPN